MSIIKQSAYHSRSNDVILREFPPGKSTLFSTFSPSRYVEIEHRQSRPVDECSEEERGGFG